MNKREALNCLAEANRLGKISDLELTKACDTYKAEVSFVEDYLYHVYVAKSLSDSLNGVAKTEEIEKAILPGQTKVINGVLHIYKKTPSGYDWRVYNGKKKIGRQVPEDQYVERSTYVNGLFPKSIDDVKEVNSFLSGSTGAKLVEDANGTRYVLKKGANTNPDHVRSEYLATQLYGILGVHVPEMELYEKNGEVYLLSKYVMGCTPPSKSEHYEEMSKNFVVDALLANWDVYQNDNCLIDASGRVLRVDNGGSLTFRAQGKTKQFDGSLPELQKMASYSHRVYTYITEDSLMSQMEECLSKREDVFHYLKIVGRDDLAKVMDKRFDTLNKELKKLKDHRESLKNMASKPRVLKPENEMYREFTEDEMKGLWDSYKKERNPFIKKDKNGWKLLGEICKSRGFDARPLVVDAKTYEDLASDDKMYPYQLFRGQMKDFNTGKSGKDHIDDLRYSDNCFYGFTGIHGVGIYSHVNDGKKQDRIGEEKYDSNAYIHALAHYSDRNRDSVAEMLLDKDARVCEQKEVIDKLEKIVEEDLGDEQKKIKDSKTVLKSLQEEISELNKEIGSINETIESDVKGSMNWDDNTFKTLAPLIEDVDWGSVDENMNPNYPKFDVFVKGHFMGFVNACGGTCKEVVKDVWEMTLPNSKEKFRISTRQWNKDAIKRSSQYAKPYHLQARLFQRWMENNHFKPILEEVKKKIAEDGDVKTKELNDKLKEKSLKMDELERDLSTASKSLYAKMKDKSLLHAAIADYKMHYSQEALGVAAAVLGYDAMLVPKNVNGQRNSYMVIFNRSKLIIKQ